MAGKITKLQSALHSHEQMEWANQKLREGRKDRKQSLTRGANSGDCIQHPVSLDTGFTLHGDSTYPLVLSPVDLGSMTVISSNEQVFPALLPSDIRKDFIFLPPLKSAWSGDLIWPMKCEQKWFLGEKTSELVLPAFCASPILLRWSLWPQSLNDYREQNPLYHDFSRQHWYKINFCWNFVLITVAKSCLFWLIEDSSLFP